MSNLHLLLLSMVLTLSCGHSQSLVPPLAKPGCLEKCGNISIPYPFGTQTGCYRRGFDLRCLRTASSTKLLLAATSIEVMDVSLASISVAYTNVSKLCGATRFAPDVDWFDLSGLPYVFAEGRNKFTAIGCERMAYFSSSNNFTSGCMSFCNGAQAAANGTCDGSGCCQVPVPRGSTFVLTLLETVHIGTTSNKTLESSCGYAFVVDQERYQFNVADLRSFPTAKLPVVLDWAVGGGQSCKAAEGSVDYACGSNSECYDSTGGGAPGYRCRCQKGFDGNPYLPSGCQDVNECSDPRTNPCSDICQNTVGSYICSCPNGTSGDGRKAGKGCIKKNTKFPVAAQIVLGIGLGLLLILVGAFYVYFAVKKNRMMELKEQYFERNGGLLLKQKIQSHVGASGNNAARMIFTEHELKQATNNFHDGRILGRGGFGTVYRGILPDDDNRFVAIKKSKAVTRAQMEQFVNEVVVLTQVMHRNVVKLLGCCLETEVPLLVYEYVPNGTLSDHIHGSRPSLLPWELRLRIAAETAEAIAYLHSSVDAQIIHRDIKSANILLDADFNAKVADFGASRVVPLRQAEVATMIQGTFGYLDPEYFNTGKLTDRSDVYSFGVVLAELLTGDKAVSSAGRPGGSDDDCSLAVYFVRSVREGRLSEILDPLVGNVGDVEQVRAVAEVARRCLQQRREDRPSMRAVAAGLEKARRTNEIPCGGDEDGAFDVNTGSHMKGGLRMWPASYRAGTTSLAGEEGNASRVDSSGNSMMLSMDLPR